MIYVIYEPRQADNGLWYIYQKGFTNPYGIGWNTKSECWDEILTNPIYSIRETTP